TAHHLRESHALWHDAGRYPHYRLGGRPHQLLHHFCGHRLSSCADRDHLRQRSHQQSNRQHHRNLRVQEISCHAPHVGPVSTYSRQPPSFRFCPHSYRRDVVGLTLSA